MREIDFCLFASRWICSDVVSSVFACCKYIVHTSSRIDVGRRSPWHSHRHTIESWKEINYNVARSQIYVSLCVLGCDIVIFFSVNDSPKCFHFFPSHSSHSPTEMANGEVAETHVKWMWNNASGWLQEYDFIRWSVQKTDERLSMRPLLGSRSRMETFTYHAHQNQ